MKGLAAFTLIEILVVVVLVSIMAAVAVLIVTNPTSEEAQETANTTNIRILQNQIEVYRAAEGAYPSTLGDLLNADPPYVRDIPGGETAWSYAADTGQISRAE
jgi:prepilin-type N-terminal cleavage/methylation domain-containing protein